MPRNSDEKADLSKHTQNTLSQKIFAPGGGYD